MNAIDMLKQDHQSVKELFREFASPSQRTFEQAARTTKRGTTRSAL
jgi:hypothetical protein